MHTRRAKAYSSSGSVY